MTKARAKQIAFELDSDATAAATRLAELRKKANAGDVELPRANALVSRMFEYVREHLAAEQQIDVRGVGAKYKSWLRALPADVAAVIAIWECVGQCYHAGGAKPVLLQDLAMSIGKLWETEVRIREAEAVNPVYMQRVYKQVQENSTRNKRHLRNLYNVAYDRVMKGEIDSTLTKSEQLQVGKFGVQACFDAGLIEQQRGTGKGGMLVQFSLHPDVHEYLVGYTDKDVLRIADRQAGAMLCPPESWTTLSDGGYLTVRRKAMFPLIQLYGVRKSERPRLRDDFTAEKMPDVFKCGNYLQSQAFKVHTPTLDAITKVWLAGGGILGVPTKAGPKKPVCPLPEDWHKDSGTEEERLAFTQWKRDATMYYTALRKWKGKVREIGGFLKVTAKYDGPLWFPVYADRRGRWYYRGTPNPQGSDLAKAVLHFHEKKALGEHGVFWLKVAIANASGFDKDRFVDRAAWVDKNWSIIEQALDEPENKSEVFGKDSPWCVFSLAWELREAYRSGNPSTYMTGQVVHQDATCSGLQHFSAMLRDPVGGRYVNLTDELKCGPKQDIYARVGDNALAAVRRDLESDDPAIRAMASFWTKTGIPRALAKKPVMTYVYGATLRGTTQHIECEVCGMPDVKWPDEFKSYEYSQYAAKKLFQGIAATVPAASAAMQWLRSIARDQPNGKRMEWTTPTGFKVQHDYLDFDEVRVDVRSCGLTKVLVHNPSDRTNTVQMQNAIAPNFVHALDAAHVTFTANAMNSAGLHMVSIHDSFGTHACDVPQMHTILREQFVRLYSQHNVLAEFLWDVGVCGETPPKGSLNIQEVKGSEFFFS